MVKQIKVSDRLHEKVMKEVQTRKKRLGRDVTTSEVLDDFTGTK